MNVNLVIIFQESMDEEDEKLKGLKRNWVLERTMQW